MSKIRSFIGEPTIADLHFSICPLHTASETPLNRKCIYYFGKGIDLCLCRPASHWSILSAAFRRGISLK